MKKLQIIKDVLVKRLEPYGFLYEGYTPHGGHCMWKLRKTLDSSVEQYVVVYKPAGGAYLRLELNTSIHNASIYMKDITNDKKYANVFFPYLDDQEFHDILVLFGDFMIEYGLKKLEEISVPLFYYHPDEQMYRDLYQNHNELAGSFTKTYQLTEDITLNGSIPVIQSMLTKKNEKIFNSDTKRLLLEITAFLGGKIIHEYGGRWEWNDYLSMCDLNGVN